MKLVIFCLFLALITSLRIQEHQFGFDYSSVGKGESQMIVGGFSGRVITDLSELNDEEKELYDFIAENYENITDYTLNYVKQQVVAGMNYCFDFTSNYDESTLELCVWTKSWENDFKQLILPDGTKIISGGFDSIIPQTPHFDPFPVPVIPAVYE